MRADQSRGRAEGLDHSRDATSRPASRQRSAASNISASSHAIHMSVDSTANGSIDPICRHRSFSGRERREAVSVRHVDPRQVWPRHDASSADQPVEMQQIGGHRIDLFVAQRFRRVEGHRAAHIVEHRRRIGPVAADRLDRRPIALQRVGAADEPVVRLAFALLAMAGDAPGLIDEASLARRSRPGGRPTPSGPMPMSKRAISSIVAGRPSRGPSARALRASGEQQRQRDSSTHRHG